MSASPDTDLRYQGSELEVFAEARIWRAYWQSRIMDFMGPRVLEVGAGIGTITRSLAHVTVDHWLSLEPDPDMAAELAVLCERGELGPRREARSGTVGDLTPDERFATAIYADVLEHIEDDRAELARVARHIEPGGTLIVLVPAHQWLFSPFDAAIGHFRRYTLRTLIDAGPSSMQVERANYLDAVGLAASVGNRFALSTLR